MVNAEVKEIHKELVYDKAWTTRSCYQENGKAQYFIHS